MEERYYVILSEGAYSDYSPSYFVGAHPIIKEELDTKGKSVGDELFDWFDPLPERPSNSLYSSSKMEKFDPATSETVYSFQLSKKWLDRMEEWLTEQGFTPLPDEIPEINVSYSEIPTNYSRHQ